MSDRPRRLFLAIWPDAPEREWLTHIVHAIAGGRKTPPENLHLTLVFLGATTADRLACYRQALQDLDVPALTLTLDRLDYWSRSRILWLGASQTPPELPALAQELNRRLAACGFTPERRPFQTHITLARDYPGPTPILQLPEPLRWRIDHMALVESLPAERSSRYVVLERWPKGPR